MAETVVIEPSEIIVTTFVTSPCSPISDDVLLPEPAELSNGRMVAVSNGHWVDVPPPAGTGDMLSLIYDPSGKASDVFNAANLQGYIDCGEF